MVNRVLNILSNLKKHYQKEGMEIVGVFGSYAQKNSDRFSDIDIAYEIDYDKFFSIYKDGFSQILRIEDIKKELEEKLKNRVDFVPFTQNIAKETTNV
jgi:predicted nucleotidyltransferase